MNPNVCLKPSSPRISQTPSVTKPTNRRKTVNSPAAPASVSCCHDTLLIMLHPPSPQGIPVPKVPLHTSLENISEAAQGQHTLTRVTTLTRHSSSQLTSLSYHYALILQKYLSFEDTLCYDRTATTAIFNKGMVTIATTTNSSLVEQGVSQLVSFHSNDHLLEEEEEEEGRVGYSHHHSQQVCACVMV